MDSPGAIGRRRGNTRSNAEDQALDQIAREVSRDIVRCGLYANAKASYIYGIILCTADGMSLSVYRK